MSSEAIHRVGESDVAVDSEGAESSEGTASSATEIVDSPSTEKSTEEGNRQPDASETLRKSSREVNRSFLAKESRTTDLTLLILKNLNKERQKQSNIFDVIEHDTSIESLETLNEEIENSSKKVNDDYLELCQINDNKAINEPIPSSIDKYNAEIELIKEAINSKITELNEEDEDEEEQRLKIMEAELGDKKRQLEDEIRKFNEQVTHRPTNRETTQSRSRIKSSPRSTASSEYGSGINEQISQRSATSQLDGNRIQPKPPNIGVIQELTSSLIATMKATKRSTLEPVVFCGNPIEFQDWEIDFDGYVESEGLTGKEPLRYLKKFVGGEARACILGYFTINTEEAYMLARRQLKDRFGKRTSVSRAMRNKLEKWPKIGPQDGKGLQAFSDFLSQIKGAMGSVPQLKILNDSQEIEKMAERLPRWLKTKWVNQVRHINRNEDREPEFTDFFHLINDQAEIMCEPLLANDKSTTRYENKSETRSSERTTHTLAISTEKQGRYCLHCEKDDHYTAQCYTMTEMKHDDTVEIFKQLRICFGCARTGHQTKDCPRKWRCKTCKRYHPDCLHMTAQDWEASEYRKSKTPETATDIDNPTDVKATEETAKQQVAGATQRSSTLELLNMVVPVYLSTEDSPSKVLTYALMDNGSDTTYMTTEIATKLQPPRASEKVSVITVNGEKTSMRNKYQIVLQGYGPAAWKQKTALIAYEQDTIPCNRAHIPTLEMAINLDHLKSIADLLPTSLNIPIGLLIGRDYADLLAPHETIRGMPGQPFAIKTVLGWTLCGGNSKLPTTSHTTFCAEKLELADAEDRKKVSQNDIKFLHILEQGLVKENGEITLPLPFKHQMPEMPNNKIQAERRLKQLLERFKKDTVLRTEYVKFMSQVISQGHAEPVVDNVSTPGRVWYIPHFSVKHPKKDKLRVVFDASATYRDHCLNDELLAGPEHINSLLGILMRFRRERVAVSCDVEKMFYNFHVSKIHRDYLRFLWVDSDLTTIKEYRMTVHLFGATSSPGVATFAIRKIASDACARYPEAAGFITHDFYVDDGLTSVANKEKAISLIKDTTEICAGANLRLHKFMSNSREVLQTLPPGELGSSEGLDLFKDNLPQERTLGMEWCTQTDQFTFSNKLLKDRPATKRGILSVIAQVYDPLGLLAPFLLQGKTLMQRACQENGAWDDKVSTELEKDWMTWKEQLLDLESVKIDRCIKPPEFGLATITELHHFSDASLVGYGACSFIRFKNSQNQVHVALIAAKARVAPLKKITIPRLELMAALEAARQSKIIAEELALNVQAEYFWSDSTAVLGFINNVEDKFFMFVANRVNEILQLTRSMQWHHVPGAVNPADIVSRGCSLATLNQTNWWSGPEFLKKPNISEHLTDDTDYARHVSDSIEMRKPKQTLATLQKNDNGVNETIEKFSSWKKLTRAVATAKKMLNLKTFKRPQLTVEDIKGAEILTIKMEQQRLFSDEICTLHKHEKVGKASKIRKLSPFLDDNEMIRMDSRSTSPLSYEEKNPAILAKSNLAKLLIAHYHEETHHQGHTMTVAALRQQGFYIVGALTMAKRYVHHCVTCKRNRAKPMEQQMGGLPPERTEQSPPFTHVGIDTFGHFIVKERRSELKRWGVIFTCLYTRAVHIEVIEDLSTESFLQALRRFQCVRGPVTTIFSDGGTNFIGGRNQLEKDLLGMDDSRMKRYLLENKITFKVNTPTASHQGGIWERQIRTIRAIFKGLTGRYASRMNTEGLRTAFYEVMAGINNRPLSTGLSDHDPMISANHLLTSKSSVNAPPPGNFDNEEIYGRNMYKKGQQLANEFWQAWTSHYLPKIECRQRWEFPRPDLMVGDIVIVMDSNTSRNEWNTGRVIATHRGGDDRVRKATIMLGTKDLDKGGKPKKSRTILERPVQKLVRIMSTDS